MADTITTYIGNGTQTDFSIPFDYLKKSFIRVTVDGTLLTGGDYGDTSVDYYFLDNTTVRLKVAPASGAEVTIRRYTSATERIVSFEDASILKATDLDMSQLQAFHIAEEARDVINDALVKDPDGNWDAKGNRITNVGDPVDGSDAINLDWYNEDAGRVQENADKTEQWRNETEGFRNETEDFRNEAEGFRDDSEYWANQAQASAGIAVSVGDKAQVAYDKIVPLAEQIEEQADQVNEQATQVNTQYNQINQWTEENRDIHQDILEVKPNLDKVAENIDDVTIVADNIEDVQTISTNIDDVRIVGGDLEGSFSPPDFTDMGRVGTGATEQVEITGGNIKIVADNIEDIQTVGDLLEQGSIDDIINSVAITTANVEDAQLAESNAKTSETNAKASENLAKDWAVKMDGLVNNEDYSSKYYAQQAKNSADTVTATSEEITQVVTEGLEDISTETIQGVSQVTSTYEQGVTNLENATQQHLTEINQAGTTNVSNVNQAGTTQAGLVEQEGTDQVALVIAEGTKQVQRVEDAGDAQIELVDTAGTTALSEVNTAGTTQTKAVNDAGTTQVGLVTTAGTTQVGLVQAAGTSATEAISAAKDSAVSSVTSTGTSQVEAVNTASSTAQSTINNLVSTATTNINASVQKSQDWAEKTDGPVEGGKYSAKYWADQASFGQVQADWNETDSSNVAYIKNKPTLGALSSKDSVAYTEVTGTPDLSVYATVASLSSYATVESLSDYALKTEIPDVSGFQTKTQHDADIQELATEIDSKADQASLDLVESTVNSMNTELDGKAPSVHTHTASQVTDFAAQVQSLINSSRITDYGRVGS